MKSKPRKNKPSPLKHWWERHTPTPWKWWTSNSTKRLSSEPTGKDGDVLYAVRCPDGLADVVVSEDDMVFIEMSCSCIEDLVKVCERQHQWLISLAERIDKIASKTQFDSIKEVCENDAKNYRSKAAHIKKVLNKVNTYERKH